MIVTETEARQLRYLLRTLFTEYLDWLEERINDKDNMKPIQNETYEQCYNKLMGMETETTTTTTAVNEQFQNT